MRRYSDPLRYRLLQFPPCDSTSCSLGSIGVILDKACDFGRAAMKFSSVSIFYPKILSYYSALNCYLLLRSHALTLFTAADSNSLYPWIRFLSYSVLFDLSGMTFET